MRFGLDNTARFLTLVLFTLASSPAVRAGRTARPDPARRPTGAAQFRRALALRLSAGGPTRRLPRPRRQPSGLYREIRDVIFSPEGERTERAVGEPRSNLARLILTPEDFEDIRNIPPLLLTPELLPRYEVRFRGEETMDGHEWLGIAGSSETDPARNCGCSMACCGWRKMAEYRA